MKSGLNRITEGTIAYTGGDREVFYVVEGNVLQKASNSKNIMVISAKASERDALSLRVSSFPGLGWVGREYFTGTEKKGDIEIHHYTRVSTLTDSAETSTMEAWIRASDRHPLEARVDTLTFRFGEITRFESTIQLPPEFNAILASERAQTKALEMINKINSGQRRP